MKIYADYSAEIPSKRKHLEYHLESLTGPFPLGFWLLPRLELEEADVTSPFDWICGGDGAFKECEDKLHEKKSKML